MKKKHVVDMMTELLDAEDGRLQFSKATARIAIMEHRVFIDGRRVTHTEVAIPCGEEHKLEVWSLHKGEFDSYTVS